MKNKNIIAIIIVVILLTAFFVTAPGFAKFWSEYRTGEEPITTAILIALFPLIMTAIWFSGLIIKIIDDKTL